MAEMHSGIKGWNARASCTVYRNLPRPHLDQGISGSILDTLHTLGFMQICFLHARSLSAAPAPVGTASKDPGHRLRRRVWQARTRNRTTKSHFFEEQLKKKALVGNNLNAVLVVGWVLCFPSGMAATLESWIRFEHVYTALGRRVQGTFVCGLRGQACQS